MSSRRHATLAWTAIALFIGVLVAAYISHSPRFRACVVVLIGCCCLILGVFGSKPERSGLGLLDILLHLLPKPVWRIAMALIGVVIIAVGVGGLLVE